MCNCNEGFKLDEKSVRCIDVDECASDSFICGVGQCVNLDGKKYFFYLKKSYFNFNFIWSNAGFKKKSPTLDFEIRADLISK